MKTLIKMCLILLFGASNGRAETLTCGAQKKLLYERMSAAIDGETIVIEGEAARRIFYVYGQTLSGPLSPGGGAKIEGHRFTCSTCQDQGEPVFYCALAFDKSDPHTIHLPQIIGSGN
jgi:hypothetical protein